ncbi:TPA_exp: putative APSES transcription factor [Trichophyton benhamiae CBS 112371]|nr:TPA_exp: putative APSES transcription factor [Trichophyton benhamiae CBS 112371]
MRPLPARRNPHLQGSNCPEYEELVARRRLGRTNLAVAPAKIGSSNATMPSNLGPFEYAHLRAPLPADLKGSEIFPPKQHHIDSYFLMRRSRDGHISASGMFKIAFPWAKHSEEADEREYLRTRPETSEDEIAGNVWISPELALELAREYGIVTWVRALLDPTDILERGDSSSPDAEAIPEPPKFDLPPLDAPLLSPPEETTARGRGRRSASPSKSASGRKMAIPRKSRRAQKESNANASSSLQTSLDAAAASPAPKKRDEEEKEAPEANGHDEDAEEETTLVKRPKERVTVEIESKVDAVGDSESAITNVTVQMPAGISDLPMPENTEKMLETAKEMVEEATKLQEQNEETEEQAGSPAAKKSSRKRKAEEIVVEEDEEEAEDPHALKRAKILEDKLRNERVRNRALFGVTATLAMAAAIPYFF